MPRSNRPRSPESHAVLRQVHAGEPRAGTGEPLGVRSRADADLEDVPATPLLEARVFFDERLAPVARLRDPPEVLQRPLRERVAVGPAGPRLPVCLDVFERIHQFRSLVRLTTPDRALRDSTQQQRLVPHGGVEDSVRKLADEGAPNVSINHRILRRMLRHGFKNSLHAIEKLMSQTMAKALVPVAGLDDVDLCAGTKGDFGCHPLRSSSDRNSSHERPRSGWRSRSSSRRSSSSF